MYTGSLNRVNPNPSDSDFTFITQRWIKELLVEAILILGSTLNLTVYMLRVTVSELYTFVPTTWPPCPPHPCLHPSGMTHIKARQWLLMYIKKRFYIFTTIYMYIGKLTKSLQTAALSRFHMRWTLPKCPNLHRTNSFFTASKRNIILNHPPKIKGYYSAYVLERCEIYQTALQDTILLTLKIGLVTGHLCNAAPPKTQPLLFEITKFTNEIWFLRQVFGQCKAKTLYCT